MNTTKTLSLTILMAALSACATKPNDATSDKTKTNVTTDQQVTPQVDGIADSPVVDGIPALPVPGASAIVPTVSQCDISKALEWMNSQTIIYTQNPSDEWRDCSGNFLRLSSRIASTCPTAQVAAPAGITEYVHGGNNKRPAAAQARTTRGLARWYDEKGVFEPVYYDDTPINGVPATLAAVRNRIRPGSVLWFSRKIPLAANGKEGLFTESGGVINHMATIVSVTLDANGNVSGWKMYHGQNSRKHNGVTSHRWTPSRPEKYPPGGFWEQRIAGFAESIVVTPPIVTAQVEPQ